jgi:hypothetical protein
MRRPQEVTMDELEREHRSPGQDDPDGPDAGLPEGAPDAVHQAARNERLGQAGEPSGDKIERGALSWLLGATRAPEYDVEVEYDTPQGMKPLTFHIRSVDGRRITAIENENTSDRTGLLDDIAANAALVSEATVYIEDETGDRSDPDSVEFRGDESIPKALAMEKRFKYQDGLLSGVTGEVRRLGGWSPDRVKRAKRSTTAGERASSGIRREPAALSPAEQAMETATGNS